MPRQETPNFFQAWQEASAQPPGSERRQAADTASGVLGTLLGGTAGALNWVSPRNEFRQRDFRELINRADYLYGNKDRFKGADPELIKAYTNRGVIGLDHAASDVWGRHIGIQTDWEPADISQAGQFDPAGKKTILTVTPEPNAARFNAPTADGVSDGGGSSGTNWGNDRFPQTGYADGNHGVRTVKANNPSTHFSVVDLPAAEQRDYMTTGKARAAGRNGETRGWGRTIEGDMHFGKEYVQGRGITTANDMYTWLKQNGYDTPALVKGDGSGNLEKLLDAYTKASGQSDRYKALEGLASPNRTWGAPERVTGQLPSLEELSFADATPEQRAAAGYNSFFEPGGRRTVRADNLPVPVDQQMSIPQDLIDVDVDAPNMPKAVTQTARRLTGRHLSGLGTAALFSRETIEQLQDGNPAGAASTLALSYGGGELLGRGGNKLVEALTRAGVTQAPALATRLGTGLATGGALEIATLAPSSTRREEFHEMHPEDPRRVHAQTYTPTKVKGYQGPDNPFAGLPVAEQERISRLPKRTRQVKAMPAGDQIVYNTQNELRYAGDELSQGRVPYLGWKLPWAK